MGAGRAALTLSSSPSCTFAHIPDPDETTSSMTAETLSALEAIKCGDVSLADLSGLARCLSVYFNSGRYRL